MVLIKKLFNFYINSSIHVALAVCCLVKITEVYFNLSNNETLNYFIFYGTITGYNFVKYAGIAKLHHLSLTDNLKLIQVFSLLCFCLMIYFGSQLAIKTLLIFIPFGVLTLFYAVPIFSKNLRNIPSLKIVVIGLVWAGVTVVLPLVDVNQFSFSQIQIVSFIQRFLLVIVLTLPFDIRDLQFDNKSLKTIPQKIGIEKTKKLGFVLLVFCLVLEFLITSNSVFKTTFLITSLTLFFFLMRASSKQSNYYSAFWVEVIPIFWFVFLLFLK